MDLLILLILWTIVSFASLGPGYQSNTKDMKMKYDLQDEISVKEFKNVVYALHNYIKTSIMQL